MRIRGGSVKDKDYLTKEEKQAMLKEIELRKEELLKEGNPDDFTGKNKVFKILTYFCLSLALVLMISYSVQTIINSSDFITQLLCSLVYLQIIKMEESL